MNRCNNTDQTWISLWVHKKTPYIVLASERRAAAQKRCQAMADVSSHTSCWMHAVSAAVSDGNMLAINQALRTGQPRWQEPISKMQDDTITWKRDTHYCSSLRFTDHFYVSSLLSWKSCWKKTLGLPVNWDAMTLRNGTKEIVLVTPIQGHCQKLFRERLILWRCGHFHPPPPIIIVEICFADTIRLIIYWYYHNRKINKNQSYMERHCSYTSGYVCLCLI